MCSLNPRRHVITPRVLSAILVAGLLLVASRPVSADEPASYQDSYEPASSQAGGGLRAPDPRKINQAPKAEDFVNDGDDTLRDIEPREPSESGGMSHVRMPEERAPKIDKPQDLAPIRPGDLNITPYSPLVKVNKSGVKPQVLKKPKGAGSVKGMGMTFTTNLQTGSASMSVPFSLPPARAGLGPSLGLSYSSGGAQGMAGIGWSFGVGFIGRQSDQGLPRYDDAHNTDRFVYNGGRELVRVDNTTTTMPNWPGVDNSTPYYRAKIEGLFMRFFRMTDDNGDTYWRAQDTNGMQYFFGGTEEDGFIPSAVVCDATCDRVFRWNLVRVKDLHDNRVEYEYDKHQGQSYLWDVYYVNKEPDSTTQNFQHHVAIFYEQRPDVLTSYQPGFPVTTARRIDEVRIYTDYGAFPPVPNQPLDGDARLMVRAYDLRYDPNLLHSMLEEVQMFGKDNTTGLPPVRFEYSQVTGAAYVPELGYINGEVQSLQSSPSDSMGDGRRDLLDIDADGLPDVFETDPTNPGNLQKYILNAGASLPEGNKLPMVGGNNLMLQNTNVRIMDMDGDGKVEMVHMPHVGSYRLYYLQCDEVPANQTGETRVCQWVDSGGIPVNPSIDLTTDGADYKLVDINGDHLIDIVRTTGTQMQHWLNLGAYDGGEGKFGHVDIYGNLSNQPITSCVLHKGLPVQFSDNRVKLADMNGDGLQDIVLVDFGTFVYWPNKGYGDWGVGGVCPAGQFGFNRYITMANAPMFSNMDVTKIYLGDVNGDGLADMMQVRTGAVDVWLNAITGFKPRAILQNSPTAPQFTDRIRLADINGSGSRDIVWGDGGNYRYIDLTGGIKPRLLVRAHNGLGGITEVDYEPSTDQYLQDREDGREWQTTCPFPTQVVREVRTRDQFDAVPGYTESIYIKRYRYSDCYYDGEEHEFRGFAEVTEETPGDDNSPTSFVTHHYYQGKPGEAHPGYTLESLSGAEYRTDVYTYATTDGQPDGNANRIYLSTSFTSYAVRKVLDAHPDDLIPGLPPEKARTARFSYAAESHSFGYNTHDFATGSHQEQVLQIRLEDSQGANPTSGTATIDLLANASLITHLRTEIQVDDFSNPLAQLNHGRGTTLDGDPIVSYTTFNQNTENWIHRPCESWIQQGSQVFNRQLSFYDEGVSTFSGASCAPSLPTPSSAAGDCYIGTKGLPTRTELEECFEGSRTLVEGRRAQYNRWGMPIHEEAFRKQERWLLYEDPRGYESMATREVVRVGTDETTPDYPETAVKTLTYRASFDVGFGNVVKYWNENGQESRLVYDVLGRITALWSPREPYRSCGNVGDITIFKAVETSYHLVPGNSPYSYLETRIFKDACDPSLVDVSFIFVDGFGRNRIAIKQGDETPIPPHTDWIATNYVSYDSKGAIKDTYEPAFVSWPVTLGAGGSTASNLPIPTPVQASCPGNDDFLDDAVLCTRRARYDAFGRLVETTLADGSIARMEYRGPLEVWQYDANDTDPSSPFHGSPSKTRRNGWGRAVEVESVFRNPDGSGEQPIFTTFFYDAVGHITSSRTCRTGDRWPSQGGACAAEDQIEKYQVFDSLGQRRRIIDPDAGTWTFQYDEAGRLVESSDGNYNASGGLHGNRIGFVYDRADRLILEKCIECEHTGSDVALVRYFYDVAPRTVAGRGLAPTEVGDEPMDYLLGNLAWVEDETGVTYMSYDRTGHERTEIQVVSAQLPTLGSSGDGEVFISRFEYDDLGRVNKLTYPGPAGEPSLVVQHAYGRRGYLRRVFGPDPFDPSATYDYISHIEYNALGHTRWIEKGARAGSTGPRIVTSKWYDRRRRLKRVETVEPGAPGHELQKLEYLYDRASNLIGIHDYRDAADVAAYTGGKNLSFDLVVQYDGLYRVTSATYRESGQSIPFGSGAMRRTMTYAYDAVGNLLQRNTTAGDASTPEDNPAAEFWEKWVGQLRYGENAGPHAMTGADGGDGPGGREVLAQYDNNGQMTSLEIQKDTGSIRY